MSDGFNGQWVQKPGGVRVPLVEPEPVRVTCRVCGTVCVDGLCGPCKASARKRVHGSHAGFAQHKRRFEVPCVECAKAEKAYQNGRYRKGSLSPVDLVWAERNAVAWSWTNAERTARVANTTT